jgi:uncharacterized phiE125 gp8 family phage protein
MLRSKSVSRTEPAAEPVDPSEVAKSLLIEYPDHDTMLRRKTIAARRSIEEDELGECLINQTCVDKFDTFDSQIELRWGPVQSVTSVQYVDTNGDTQTLATSVYELRTIHRKGVIELKYGQSWPSVRSDTDAITITYVAGYGTSADDVPEEIRDAITIRAGWLYRDRDEGIPEPLAVASLLSGRGDAQVVA